MDNGCILDRETFVSLLDEMKTASDPQYFDYLAGQIEMCYDAMVERIKHCDAERFQ